MDKEDVIVDTKDDAREADESDIAFWHWLYHHDFGLDE